MTLQDKLKEASQGMDGTKQTALVMCADNDGTNIGIGLGGLPHVLGYLFLQVFRDVASGRADEKCRIIYEAVMFALHEAYTAAEIRDKFNDIDRIKAQVEVAAIPNGKA